MKKEKKEKKEKLNKKVLMANLKEVWKYMRRYKKHIILYVLFVLFTTGLGVILPLISAKIVLYLTDGLFEELMITSLVILGLNLVESVVDYFKGICSEYIERNITNAIQIDFIHEFLKLEVSEIDKSSTGAFIERLNNDALNLGYIFFRLSHSVSGLLSKLGTMVTVFILNKYIFFYYMLVALGNLLMDNKMNKERVKHWEKIKVLNEEKTSIIGELVRGIRDIKVLNAKEIVMEKSGDRINSVTQANLDANKKFSKFYVIKGFYRNLTDCIFFALGIFLCHKSLLTTPVFLIVYNYSWSISYLFTTFSDLSSAFREFNLSAERILDIINGRGYKKETFGTKKLSKVKGNIEFKDVSFAYKEGKDVIKNMNFKVDANQVVGFVGRSGAGKSTIFSLITRLYSIDRGTILLDGVDISELDESSLRDNMSIITQNPYIFDFSIKENLLIANPKASMRDIRKCCKLASIDDYIMSLDDKYETKLGEGGLILSGGQKQRLAIARALLMKTKFILFDEATSALDNETQANIQEAIKNLKGDYTIMIIAHRLSTVVGSDKIIVIDKGKVIAEGPHRKLIKDCPVYQKLYKTEKM